MTTFMFFPLTHSYFIPMHNNEHQAAAAGSIFGVLAALFRELEVQAVLVGGYAVNAYHYSRFTHDIDFMIRRDDFPAVASELAARGFNEMTRTDLFARFSEEGGKIVDFLFVDPDTFGRILAESTETRIGGASLLLPSLRHLVAMKLHSARTSPQRRDLIDLADIVMMLKKSDIDVQEESFKKLCLKFGGADLYAKIIAHFS